MKRSACSSELPEGEELSEEVDCVRLRDVAKEGDASDTVTLISPEGLSTVASDFVELTQETGVPASFSFFDFARRRKPAMHPLNHIACMRKAADKMLEGTKEPRRREFLFEGNRYETIRTAWRNILVKKNEAAKMRSERSLGCIEPRAMTKVGSWIERVRNTERQGSLQEGADLHGRTESEKMGPGVSNGAVDYEDIECMMDPTAQEIDLFAIVQ